MNVCFDLACFLSGNILNLKHMFYYSVYFLRYVVWRKPECSEGLQWPTVLCFW
jgi:hypothetical protein